MGVPQAVDKKLVCSGAVCGVEDDGAAQSIPPENPPEPESPSPSANPTMCVSPEPARNSRLICRNEHFSRPIVARNFCEYDPSLNFTFDPNFIDAYQIHEMGRQANSCDPDQQNAAIGNPATGQEGSLTYAIRNHPEEVALALNEVQETYSPEQVAEVRQGVQTAIQVMSADPEANKGSLQTFAVHTTDPELRREAVAASIGTIAPPRDSLEEGVASASVVPESSGEGPVVHLLSLPDRVLEGISAFFGFPDSRSGEGTAPIDLAGVGVFIGGAGGIEASGGEEAGQARLPHDPSPTLSSRGLTTPPRFELEPSEERTPLLYSAPLSPRTYDQIVALLLQVATEAGSPGRSFFQGGPNESEIASTSGEAQGLVQFCERLRDQERIDPEEMRRGAYGILRGLADRGGENGLQFTDPAYRHSLQIGFDPGRRELFWRFLRHPIADPGERLNSRWIWPPRFAGHSPAGPVSFGRSVSMRESDGTSVVFVPLLGPQQFPKLSGPNHFAANDPANSQRRAQPAAGQNRSDRHGGDDSGTSDRHGNGKRQWEEDKDPPGEEEEENA